MPVQPQDDDDDRPIETTARKQPGKLAMLGRISEVIAPVKRRGKSSTVDPRFDKTISKTNPNALEHQYQFMSELASQDAAQMRWRLRHASRELRRRAREEKIATGEDDVSSDTESTQDDDDTEEALTATGMSHSDRSDQKIRYGLLDDYVLKKTCMELRKAIATQKSMAGDARAKARKAEARRANVKTELAAMRSGTKRGAFFMKRGALKEETARREFDSIANSASAMPSGKARSGDEARTRTVAALEKLQERALKRSARGTR